MAKIKKIEITGLRGVRGVLSLTLDSKSILLFGENAAGKSTISDVIEWFYNDKIEHLSIEEIGIKGLEALRNAFLKEDEKGSIYIEFSDGRFNSDKSIAWKRKKLETKHSNVASDFENYINFSQKENLILRYRDLVNFILATKSKKLQNISDIIGFSELTSVRKTLLQSRNALAKEIKIKDFDNQISVKQSQIIKYLKQVVVTDDQMVAAVNFLVGPLNLDIAIKNFLEIDTVVETLKKFGNSEITSEISFYQRVVDFCETNISKVNAAESNYFEYYKQFSALVADEEKLNKIILEKLVLEGLAVIAGGAFENDKCPLCLQQKKSDELQKELLVRSGELKSVREEKAKTIALSNTLRKSIGDIVGSFDGFISDKYFDVVQNAALKQYLVDIKKGIEKYLVELKVDISKKGVPSNCNDMAVDLGLFKKAKDFSNEKISELRAKNLQNNVTDIIVGIEHSRAAYSEIKNLQCAKAILEKQQSTIQIIFDSFTMKQRDALNSFIVNFSEEWNAFYKFMNPDEKVDEIKLLLLGDDDELNGITIQFKFFNNEVSPPQRYLSESHLNCLGIAFFLASVKAFNETNKFIVLDDVISSFDSYHRKRFSDLLLEKFSDYQIILLTHEKGWFDYVNNQVKNKNWFVKRLQWNETDGSYLDEAIDDLRKKILQKIADKNTDNLGNDLRKYLEGFLKDIVYNLKVRVEFRYNDINEDRMSNELLTSLKGAVLKQADDILKNNSIFDRLLGSVFVGNKDSHNCSYVPSLGDLTAFWIDVQDLEKIFLCNSCAKIISMRYYDEVGKNIRCGCGKKIYAWKK